MKRNVLLVLAAVAVLAIGSAAIASNMGFKISIPLTAGQAKFVSLPFYNSYTDAASLRNDIIASGGTSVSVYDYTGTAWQRYSGGGTGQVNFTITTGTTGKGYEVVSAAAVSNWIVVGSHNPSLAISLTGGQAKYVSVPYHTTDTTAATLRNEIIAAGGTSVSVYDYTGTAWQRYSGGGTGQVNFNLTAGKAIEVVSAASVANWVPAHY
jgi:hypothetical protein